VGADIPINLNFDGVAVGHYELQVCSPEEIVFPADDTTFTIHVQEGC